MRFHLLGLLLLAAASAPAAAQTSDRLDRRVERLERDLQAVQRRVFPGGNVEPEIRPVAPAGAAAGVPAGEALADLTARVDAMERQIATLTGASEENGYRLRQLEQALAAQKRDIDARIARIERPAEPSPAPAEPIREPAREPAAPSVPAPSTGDAGEDAYLAGYRLWEAKDYVKAQAALEAMAVKYPRHAKASWARNLAGRAALDDGRAAAAAKILLANYQANPDGERAQDSLYFLGDALVALKQPANACKVYDELASVYAGKLRPQVASRLPAARTAAKCK